MRTENWSQEVGTGAQAGAIECSAGKKGAPCLEGAALSPRPELWFAFFKAQKVSSKRVPCDQKSVLEHLSSAEGAAGASGDRAMRKLQPRLDPRQQTKGLDAQEWGCTNGLGGEGMVAPRMGHRFLGVMGHHGGHKYWRRSRLGVGQR